MGKSTSPFKPNNLNSIPGAHGRREQTLQPSTEGADLKRQKQAERFDSEEHGIRTKETSQKGLGDRKNTQGDPEKKVVTAQGRTDSHMLQKTEEAAEEKAINETREDS